MSYTQCRTIQFFGGPLDGHVETLFPPVESLLVVKTMALSPQPHWLTRLLRMLLRHPKRNVASVAVYQLRSHGDDIGYLFLRSSLSSAVKEEAGSVQVVDDTIGFQRVARSAKAQSHFSR